MSENKKLTIDIELLAKLAGVAAVLLTAVGWAFNLSAEMRYMGKEVTEIRVEIQALRAEAKDRWTRTQHDQWVREEFRPLEERVRLLEKSSAGK